MVARLPVDLGAHSAAIGRYGQQRENRRRPASGRAAADNNRAMKASKAPADSLLGVA